MVIIPIPMYPLYIKKEDARDVAKWQRKSAAFVLMGVTIVLGVMQWLVSPKLLNLYADLKISPPTTVQYSQPTMIVLAVISLISSLYLLFSESDYQKIDAVASKYKNGEMIKTRELVDNRSQWLVLGTIGVMVAYLILTTVLPIYNLTSGM